MQRELLHFAQFCKTITYEHNQDIDIDTTY